MTVKAEYYSYTRNELLPLIPSGIKTSLDIGCGMGVFSQSIKEQLGAETWGVEPAKEAAEVASKRLDKVCCGYFDNITDQLPKYYFDCIFFNDVLEHMIHPENALKAAHSYLSANGVIICSIPNIRFFPQLMELLIARDWKYRDQGILDRTHIRFFTRKSMVRMFLNCDFEIVHCVGVNRIQSKKYIALCHIANALSAGRFSDCFHQQYAFVLKSDPGSHGKVRNETVSTDL